MERALFRANLYAEAGADLVLIHSSLSGGSEAVEVARRWSGPVPLVSIPTAFLHRSQAALARLGYRMIILANQLLRASIWNMEGVLEVIRMDRAAVGVQERAVSMQHIFDLAVAAPPRGEMAPDEEPEFPTLARRAHHPASDGSDSLPLLGFDARTKA